jgi:branched-chain amino acid transport system substrate-binding protein
MSEKDEGQLKASVSRRDFLKIAGVAGATIGAAGGLGGLVAACGGSTTTTAASPITTAATTATTGAASTETTAAGATTTSVSASAETGREIKIGFVSPQTGGIADFGIPDKYCAARATEAIGDGVVCGDGKKHPITIVIKDSQSDTNRASQVAGDLINNDKVDLVTAASTPDTVAPVADQCESGGMPCITNDCPWQPYIASRAQGKLDAVFKWTYHTFWGLEDVQANFLDMWGQLTTNKKVAAMFPNDADGNAWLPGWKDVWGPAGLSPTVPSQFQDGTEDFSAQISAFKAAGCEIGMGVFIPPDMANFWKQATQQGWKPKAGTYAKALLFPQAVEAIGVDIANGLTTEVWWTPSHPFTSALLNETCQQFADKYTAAGNGQWTQPLLHFIVFEMAIDTLKRTTSVDDKEAIVTAIKGTKLQTIGGLIDFTAPVVGPTPPFKVGPCHITENVYKTPLVGGQWLKGTKYPMELTVVTNAGAPGVGIPVGGKIKEYGAA